MGALPVKRSRWGLGGVREGQEKWGQELWLECKMKLKKLGIKLKKETIQLEKHGFKKDNL